ncbi:MAG: ABC transporter permease [Acidobacteriota bacterium]
MIAHALKLVWNRKRQNALVLLELVGAFLILFALLVAVLGAWQRFSVPIGFDPEDVWVLTARSGRAPAPGENGERLLTALREHPAVQSAGMMQMGLYTTAGMNTGWYDDNGELHRAEVVSAGPNIDHVLGLDIVDGRWFEAEDQQAGESRVVVDRAFAETIFEADSPVIGEPFRLGDRDENFRVIGLVEHYRKGGELTQNRPVFFRPMWPDEDLQRGWFNLAVAVQPGAPPEVEEALVRRLRAEYPDWSFDISRVEEQRTQHLEQGATPLIAAGVVALFLLFMVGLGLTGVLWQNVSRRTREIGLRRAQGATAAAVRWQIVVELMVLAVIGVLLGGVFAAQLPLLGLLSMRLDVGLQAFLAAAATLLGLTVLCGLYPSWLASRVAPAQALHHQ